MSGAILQQSTRPDADVGVVFIEVSGCLPMCGHGTIGTATVLVETGMVPVKEPVTVIRLDTPAGSSRPRSTVRRRPGQDVGHYPERALLTCTCATSRCRGPGAGRGRRSTSPGAATSSRSLPAASWAWRYEPALHDELVRPPVCGHGRRQRATRLSPIPTAAAINTAAMSISPRPATGDLPAPGRGGHPPRLARPLALRDRHLVPGWPSSRPRRTGLDQDYVHASVLGTTFTGRLRRHDHRRRFPRRRPDRARPGLADRRWATTCSTRTTRSRPAS